MWFDRAPPSISTGSYLQTLSGAELQSSCCSRGSALAFSHGLYLESQPENFKPSWPASFFGPHEQV